MKQITFPTTHWSVVLAAKWGDTKALAALRELCESYRQPILRYVERVLRTDSSCRYGGRNAEDLTHDFLTRLLEGKMFEHLRQREGRFRTYLFGTVRHFLANIRQHESAVKRGGGIVHLPIRDDIPQAEDDAMFDHDWATTTIDYAIVELGDSLETRTLLPWLTRELVSQEREQLALELGKSENAIKVALHRLRKKFRHYVRERIARTVESDAEIEAELDHLIQVLM